MEKLIHAIGRHGALGKEEIMLLPKRFEKSFFALYGISNQVIRYRLDTEILRKKCRVEDYLALDGTDSDYWLNVHEKNKIHGKDDACFENSVSKLLDYGFTKDNAVFHDAFCYLLDDAYWADDGFMQIIAYPFLVRAGYLDNGNVRAFFHKRMDRIINAIEKYRYDYRDVGEIKSRKYRDEFRFLNDWVLEPLPTIYDIYAYAYYPGKDPEVGKKIENVVEYALNEKFQSIPDNAYVYDTRTKRYYAAGSVYHACLREERKLLNILLFSNFKAIRNYPPLINGILALLESEDENGFFVFDSSVLKERKNGYQMYSGSHMGLGVNRKSKDCAKIESTFIMLKIISNLHRNGIDLD